MWKISKWRRENEKYLYQWIQYRLLLTKVQFPAKLNTAHGEVHVCKSTVVDEIQGIKQLFSSIYRFKVIM